ncbi:pyridoxal kinase [Clostridia bacterium]|nr:pyridoxal kinase [Clostridia bacterium]
MTQKRVMAIHDMSGFGRCSLTVALPALSAMGAQCVPLPTAFLSAHTAFPDFTFHDMTAEMRPAFSHWRDMGLTFDALYSGFLGSAEQIDIVAECFDAFPGALVVVDPVMGDGGKAYKTYTPEMCSRVRELTLRADLITPNVTEAAILLGLDYGSAPKRYEDFQPWLEALSNGGTSSVVITGIQPAPCRIGQAYYNRDTGDFGCCERPFVGRQFHGTGDLYSSVLVGKLLQGKPLAEAADLSAGFVRECCELSFGDGTPSSEGVRFEPLLWKLGEH